MTEMEQGLVNATYILGIIVFLFIWLFFMRIYYARKVVGRVLCGFITKEGNMEWQLLPVVSGLITMPATKKTEERKYAVANIATFLTDYPPAPKWMSFIQIKAKGAIFDKESWEPISNRCGRLLLSPVRLANVINQGFSQLGLEQAREEQSEKEKATKKGIPWVTVLLVILILALVVVGYYVSQNMDVFKAAMGVQ